MTQHIFDAHCLLNEYMNLELLTVTLNRWKMPLKNEDRQKKKKKIPNFWISQHSSSLALATTAWKDFPGSLCIPFPLPWRVSLLLASPPMTVGSGIWSQDSQLSKTRKRESSQFSIPPSQAQRDSLRPVLDGPQATPHPCSIPVLPPPQCQAPELSSLWNI